MALIYGMAASLAVGGVYNSTLRAELASLQQTGQARLDEAASRLRLQIDGYRAQTNFIAQSSGLARGLLGGNRAHLADELLEYAVTYGAARIDLVTGAGRILASSDRDEGGIWAGDTAVLRAARNERLGFAQAREDGHRLIQLSRRVPVPGEAVLVVLSVDLAALEFEWPVTPEPVVFFDASGRAFSANRLSLLELGRAGGGPSDLALRQTGQIAGHALWQFPNGAGAGYVALSQYVPHLDLTAQIFLRAEPILATARLRAMLGLALALVLGLIAAVAAQGRRRLAQEARHSATLEARVEARTSELRAAQSQLVEASKLSALGRMSAGISHELNQPLGAILNFASNGQKFIARGAPDRAAENLTRISDQVQRMTRIITNLRAFARQELTPTAPTEFATVIRNALTLMEPDLTADQITQTVTLPDSPVWVRAGQVRLEQVVVNLVSNARDAMAGRPEKHLTLHLRCAGPEAILTVRDTGRGIEDPTQVFEPFYTTKDLGASKGLGLGLSLSFGIISGFGGHLSCDNHPNGAEFRVALPLTHAPKPEPTC